MRKFILIVLVTGLLLLCFSAYQYFNFHDNKLHIVFCDVGQGDAILVKTPSGKIVLFDGGPSDEVINCLGNHLPFWHRRIDLMMLSHPHLDHFVGLMAVVDHYDVQTFVTEKLTNDIDIFKEFLQSVHDAKIKTEYVYAHNAVGLVDGVRIKVLGPAAVFLHETSPNGIVGERKEFASLIVEIGYKNFTVLLTGDSQANELKNALSIGTIPISVLQVPHHGSASGLDQEVLERARPKLAVISVGKNNRYGHPRQEILKILRDNDIRILRTDENGEVEIVTDGKQVSIK